MISLTWDMIKGKETPLSSFDWIACVDSLKIRWRKIIKCSVNESMFKLATALSKFSVIHLCYGLFAI